MGEADEYEFDGAVWRVAKLGDLIDGLDTAPDELAEVHRVLAEHSPEVWDVVRAVYGVAPVVLEDPKEASKWDGKGIDGAAKLLGIRGSEVDSALFRAKRLWAQLAPVDGAGDAPAEPGAVRQAAAATEEEIDRLLEEAGMDYLVGDVRAFAAGRLRAYSKQLQDPAAVELVVATVGSEIELRRLRRRHSEQVAIGDSNRDQITRGEADKKAEELSKKIRELEGAYKSKLEALGATPEKNKSLGQGARLVDAWSSVLEGMQEFHATGDRELIDGVFTASEIAVMVKPVAERPNGQWRPEIVAWINASRPFLWDPTWECPEPTRAEVRYARRVVDDVRQALAAEMEIPEASVEEAILGKSRGADAAVEDGEVSGDEVVAGGASADGGGDPDREAAIARLRGVKRRPSLGG